MFVVCQLVRFTPAVRKNDNGLLHRGLKSRIAPIRHVLYVIGENRTYDRIFGDLKQGNGDPSLVHFGRNITPNHHKLAEDFVLLDNFYTPADQSALGHRWCTQGYAGDWVHKYSNGRNDQNPMLFAPNDFLWDAARLHRVSVLTVSAGSTPSNPQMRLGATSIAIGKTALPR